MKNKTVLLVLLVYCLLLTGCGDAPVSERFAELSEKYDYYEKSIDQLKVIKDSTPEQLDDIFLILIDCGMDSEVTTVSEKFFLILLPILSVQMVLVIQLFLIPKMLSKP